ncbi:hypothetical protein V498_06375, partial [Pseudogymnoascus sp. VKM F-4517 (FW-2822)]
MSDQDQVAPENARSGVVERGPFVLKALLEDVPLSADGDREDIVINCIEYWESNLYVGTSASEILHFVQIPPDPSDDSDFPSYILASRLCPAYSETSTPERPGVQQILLLPAANKACVLCNSTVTFYSLPELSPVFGNQKVPGSNWIGGLDLNNSQDDNTQGDKIRPVMVLLSLKRKIRSVRIGEEARQVKSIDFAGCTITARRDAFACVADSRSYALLDVDRQLKIPLFPISSLDDSQSGTVGGKAEDISGHTTTRTHRSTSSTGEAPPQLEPRGHNRSTSLGTFMGGGNRQPSQDRSRETVDPLFRESSPAPSLRPSGENQRESSPGKSPVRADKPLPEPPSTSEASSKRASMIIPSGSLKPHIISPSPQEFLLVTGTGTTDPGLGLFVNLEGDISRSALEFSRYPEALVTDGRGVGTELSQSNAEEDEEGYVLAVISQGDEEETHYGLEIQRWDIDSGENTHQKYWLQLPDATPDSGKARVGIRTVTEPGDLCFNEVARSLRSMRFRPFPRISSGSSSASVHSTDSRTAASLERVSKERELFESQDAQGDTPLPAEWEADRNEEELQFAQRLGRAKSRVVVWAGDKIWWVARNPLALQLDAALEADGQKAATPEEYATAMTGVINTIRGREARTEIEFMSLGYIRQRAGLLLLTNLLRRSEPPTETEYRAAEEALLEGGLDPRVVIALNPELRSEIVEGKTGIWIPTGIAHIASSFISLEPPRGDRTEPASPHSLHFYQRFLSAWRERKGFGSIASENDVFRTVDAALLLVLLRLDASSPPGPALPGSTRADLNDLVDHGVDCFSRAVALLESHHRLYILSRLYQSRKLAAEVLATWRRIIEGARDDGAEFVDGEIRVREYLAIIRNPALVQDFGLWLASRNPQLGIQVFADPRARVSFSPAEVVSMLRDRAPNAVTAYLEHLVFARDMPQHGAELLAHYLDVVLGHLRDDPGAREALEGGYETYRALPTPKPPFRAWMAEYHSALAEEPWWAARVRMLQLLGAEGADYDVDEVRKRVEPLADALVLEMIVLCSRRGAHEDALRLLVRGLGDYDGAIRYALLGGGGTYHPVSGALQGAAGGVEEQRRLFRGLLGEFLGIEDIGERVEMTGVLLGRFGGWFDVMEVLGLAPEGWSVSVFGGFLESALRRVGKERREGMVVRALAAAENLAVGGEWV